MKNFLRICYRTEWIYTEKVSQKVAQVIEAIILDSTPLGLITGRQDRIAPHDCRNWAIKALSLGIALYVPEIADYEVRRELIRAGKTAGINRLNAFLSLATYLPITTEAMRIAAQLWADARNTGNPTADVAALDGDVIVAAQALTLNSEEQNFIVASQNVRHLSRFVPAKPWQEINFES